IVLGGPRLRSRPQKVAQSANLASAKKAVLGRSTQTVPRTRIWNFVVTRSTKPLRLRDFSNAPPPAQFEIQEIPLDVGSPESKWLLHKRSFGHSIQQHGGKRFRKLLKCIV